jgi:hypothetical protein
MVCDPLPLICEADIALPRPYAVRPAKVDAVAATKRGRKRLGAYDWTVRVSLGPAILALHLVALVELFGLSMAHLLLGMIVVEGGPALEDVLDSLRRRSVSSRARTCLSRASRPSSCAPLPPPLSFSSALVAVVACAALVAPSFPLALRVPLASGSDESGLRPPSSLEGIWSSTRVAPRSGEASGAVEKAPACLSERIGGPR